jgi:hypothetical protein
MASRNYDHIWEQEPQLAREEYCECGNLAEMPGGMCYLCEAGYQEFFGEEGGADDGEEDWREREDEGA